MIEIILIKIDGGFQALVEETDSGWVWGKYIANVIATDEKTCITKLKKELTDNSVLGPFWIRKKTYPSVDSIPDNFPRT